MVALVALGVGLMFAQPENGPTSLVLRRDAGGAVLRRLLPAVILIPLVLGYIHTQCRLRGIYDLMTGTGVLVIALILVFSILLWSNAALLSLSATAEAKALRAVRESEARLNHAQLIANVGSWEWNIETGALAWSDQVYRQFGEQPGRFAPTHDAFRQRIHPEDRASFSIAIEQALEGARPYEREYRIVRTDGSIRILHSRGEVLSGPDGRPGRMIGVCFDITERKRAEDNLRRAEENLRQANADLERKVQERTAELAKRAAQLRALAGKLTLSEQRERRRMAKVMHDHLQQILVAAKFRVAILGRTGDDVVRQAALEVQNLLDESIRTSRSLTAQLGPPILHDAGLGAGLEWLARWMADRHGLIVDLKIEEGTPPLAADIRTMLFESTRELLFNTVKHARVHAASVDVRRVEDDLLQVTVSDEGRGFEPTKVAAACEAEGGFGLFGIREHMELFGGQMEIDSAPGRGSRFMLRIPLVAPDARAKPAMRPQEHDYESQLPEPAITETNTRIRVVLADDHVVMRQGLAQLLGHEPDFLIVGEAADGQEAVEQARELCPDVILMDVSMPRLSGVEATRIIHNEYPEIRILGLSMFEDAELAQAMRGAGAAGYVVKSGPSSDLIAAIRASVGNRTDSHCVVGNAPSEDKSIRESSEFCRTGAHVGRVALVGPELEENLSLRYLASSLSSAGVETDIIPFDVPGDLPRVVTQLLHEALPPSLIGLSLSFQLRAKDFLALAVELRRRGYAGHITAGGHFGTFAGREIMKDFPEIDSICLHESEETIKALALALSTGSDLASIAGMLYRSASGNIIATNRPRAASISPDSHGRTAAVSHLSVSDTGSLRLWEAGVAMPTAPSAASPHGTNRLCRASVSGSGLSTTSSRKWHGLRARRR